MKYDLLKGVLGLLEDFESNESHREYSKDVHGFRKWISDTYETDDKEFVDWEGKDKGRSTDSVISTLLVHMNRFAKNYSKAAILDSAFSTQEDFIYLINLKAFGKMTKMDLIKKNVQDKPGGMLIINRLMAKGWVEQEDSELDKRSKIISITALGLEVLDKQMVKIRQASNLVTGNLTSKEKLVLIELLTKLSDFHQEVYDQNFEIQNLLSEASLYKN